MTQTLQQGLALTQDDSSYDDEATRQPRPFWVASTRCRCGGCGRYFTCVGAFKHHQTLDHEGRVVCQDPASRGLAIRRLGDRAWWGWPGSRPDV